MRRLIEKGLMFGNLVEVAAPALVARYNRALEQLTGKRTALTDFHVDISGFSPEIADELDDWSYLNPPGANRQFILLTLDQKTAPLLSVEFSMSRGILRQFIDANEAQLFALTARDAVMGELENSVFDLSAPSRLLDIRRVTVRADTTEAHVTNATELQGRIDQFLNEPDAWWDDVLVAEMIELAKKTGDVTRAPLVLSTPTFDEPSFWTSRFGGTYLFRRCRKPFIVSADAAAFKADPSVDLPVFDLSDANGIARALSGNDLVEPVVQSKGQQAAAILRQKVDFLLVDALAAEGAAIPQHDRGALRRAARSLDVSLPSEIAVLTALERWALGSGAWPRIESADPAYFYSLRAVPTDPDRDLVNQLLAELAPRDVRRLFICHKPLFYKNYSEWPDTKKAFVADFLEAEYLADKAGTRTTLFGQEDPPMAEDRPTLVKSSDPRYDSRIAAVGPWGAVRRN